MSDSTADNAGGLITDAQGEAVQEHPGGVFDPRAFRPGGAPLPPVPAPDDAAPDPSSVSAPPPTKPMIAPGDESEKAR